MNLNQAEQMEEKQVSYAGGEGMSADRLLEDALRYIADTPLHSRELDWLEDQIQQALAALRGPEPD